MTRHAAVKAILPFVFASALSAQTAQITGLITDSSAAVVPNAQVTVKNVATGVARSVASNGSGYYTAPLLTRGEYEISVQLQGFRPARQTGVKLDESQVLRVDFALEAGQVTEVIEVSGRATLLQTEDSAVGSVVTNKSVVELPLVGRNPLALAALNASVRATGAFGDLPVSSFDGSRASIGGGPPSSNNYMVDGAAAENFTSGGMNVYLSVDATEEFRIVTKNPSAEYGRTAGGVINVTSKSGTNDIHGTAYWFHRNKVLNANSYFSNMANRARPPLVFNQWGATVGAPIKKDKTFFFFNYEGFKQRAQEQAFRTVPTSLQRAGDFSQTFASNGRLINVYDPLTTRADPANPANRIRDAFPGNRIPANRISPVAAEVTKFYPVANDPGAAITQANNFFGQGSTPLDKKLWGLRLDHYLTPTRRIFGRYTYDATFRAFANYYGNVAEINTSDLDYPRKSAIINYTDNLRSNLLFEAKAGFNRYAAIRPARSLGFDVTTIKMPASLNNQVQLPLFPRFTITDVTAIGGDQADQLIQGNNSWTFGGALTWIRGAHNIKMGAEERVYQLNNSQGSPVMQFTLGRGFTQGPNPNNAAVDSGHGFATFLLGNPTAGQARRYPYTTYTQKNFATFIQDDWKVTPKLTLNLGLRWEFEGGITDRYDLISNFDPNVAYRVGNVNFTGGTTYPNVGGNSRGYRENWYRDFGPRVGFAYQVVPKTILRGGWGIFYPGTTGNFVRIGQAGFARDTLMVTSTDGGFTPADTLSDPFPRGIDMPLGSAAGPGAALGSAAEGNVRNLARPYAMQWNFNVQREFSGGWLTELGYIGNHGVHLAANRAYTYFPSQYASMGTALQQQVPNPYFGVITTGTLSNPQVSRGTLLAPFPQFTGAGTIDHWANSIYHGLSARAERRFANGFSLSASYVWSKLIDDNLGNGNNAFFNGGNNGVQDWDNLRAERAVSTANLPHRLVLSGLWELPFVKSASAPIRAVAAGWQIGSIVTLQSGEPIGVTQNGVAFGGTRPNLIGDPKVASPSIDNWLNPAAFQLIQPFTYGNAPRNLDGTRTDSLFLWDFSVLKNVRLHEKAALQLRGEFFNFTNTPTFGNPGANRSAGDFGIVRTYATNVNPRRVQIAMKIIF